MPDAAAPSSLLYDLLARLHTARAGAGQDPFGDPVLLMALAISRRVDDGLLDLAALEALVQDIADDAAAGRARRLAAYLGHEQGRLPALALEGIATRLVRPDPLDSPVPFAAYREAVERTRFSAVFTAHPTFSLPASTGQAIAEAASTGQPPPGGLLHRPAPIDLASEFAQANAAITRGRDALDAFARAMLEAARSFWPDR